MVSSITPIPALVQGKSTLYDHPDPLLRRLRLEDPYGRPIETLSKDFRGKEIIVFFIGSVHGNQNLQDLNKDLISLALKQPKTCSIVYVSVDTTQNAVESVAKNKPYLRMSLLDNSDFAAMETEDNRDLKKRVALEEVLRDEDFVSGEEYAAGGVKIEFGKEQDPAEYVRPISRAALTQIAQAYGTPSLAVYHIPTHQFLSTNTRASQFRIDRIQENYNKWTNGTNRAGFWDIFDVIRFPVIALTMGSIYYAFVLIGGQEWNVIPRIFERLELAPPHDFALGETASLKSVLSTHVKPLMVAPRSSNGGLLPYWLSFVSVLAVFNTVQSFVSATLCKRIYGRKPEQVTGVGRRTFGVWTLLSAAVRLYTAYQIHNPALYNLSIVSYILAGGHFLSELFIYKTAAMGPGALSPVVVASSSFVWMMTQKAHYLSV